MRFDSGRMGGGFLGWALPVAGVTPLLLARGPRWAWAVRGSTMYLASVGSVWALGNGWVSASVPRPEVLYVVGAMGLAVSAAMGVAAIERDLRTYRFGWRQLAPITAVGAVVLALGPPSAAAFDGAWRMPDQEFNQLFEQLPGSDADRVLWIGHDDVLATGGRPFTDGLTFAVSSTRSTGFVDRWAGSPQPADSLIEDALTRAVQGGTNRLGRLLAPFAIGEVIVVSQAAPAPATGVVKPVPDSLVAALTEQLDLAQVEVSPGLIRYRNDSMLAVASVVEEGFLSGQDLRTFAAGREPFESGVIEPTNKARTEFSGPVAVGQEIYLAVPRESEWTVSVDGREASEATAIGWASAFSPSLSGEAIISHRTAASHRAMMIGQVALWALAIVSLMRLNARAREHTR